MRLALHHSSGSARRASNELRVAGTSFEKWAGRGRDSLLEVASREAGGYQPMNIEIISDEPQPSSSQRRLLVKEYTPLHLSDEAVSHEYWIHWDYEKDQITSVKVLVIRQDCAYIFGRRMDRNGPKARELAVAIRREHQSPAASAGAAKRDREPASHVRTNAGLRVFRQGALL
jgi:hypothetical protein